MKYDLEMSLPSKNSEYEKAVKKCINLFWWQKRDGKTLSIAELKNRWRYVYRHDNEEAVDGAEELWNFYTEFFRDESKIHGIDITNKIEIGNHTVVVNIDLVRGPADYPDEAEIVHFIPGRFPKDFTIASDINITLQSYAYRKWYHKNEDRVLVFYSRKKKAFVVRKTEIDFVRLEYIVNNIAKCISENILVPRSNCSGCEHQVLCLKGAKIYEQES